MRKLHDTTSVEEEDDTSRGDMRRAERVREDALSLLGRRLSELNSRRLDQLDLPESVLEAVLEAQRIKSLRAKGRQLRVVRNMLRDSDWAAIRVRLDQLLLHGTVASAPNAANSQAESWVVRLVGEGDSALDQLLSLHPSADRKHLRQLIQSARKGSPERRKRAEQRLADNLRFLVSAG